MRLIPNSHGTHRFREFNPCHDPKSGQFAAKGQGNCEPGELTDKGRQRALYGQQYAGDDLIERVNLDNLDSEVERLQEVVDGTDDDEARAEVKDQIARALTKRLIKAGFEQDLKDFHGDDYYGAIESFYNEINEGSSGKSQDELQDEYDEYYTELRDEVAQQAWGEARDSYIQARDEYIESVDEAIELLREVRDEGRAQYGHADELAKHPVLPGVERSQKTVNPLTVLQNEFEDVLGSEGGVDVYELRRALKNPEVRAALADRLATVELEDLTEDQKVEGSDYFEGNGDTSGGLDMDDPGFARYRRDQNLYPDDVEPDALSFESWKEEKGYSSSAVEDYSDAEKTVAYMVKKWADTSGDADPLSLAAQLAINEEFGLGATYTGHYVERTEQANTGVRYGTPDALQRGQKLYAKHGEFLRGFAREMYNHTQSKLKSAGVPEYVTVFRGFGIDNKEPAFKTVNFERGDVIDVLLQPASSFSSDFGTARGFSSNYRGSLPALMAMRVPRSQILSTARTGYGALNEHEVTILGGRYPAFVIDTTPTQTAPKFRHDILNTFDQLSKRYRNRLKPPRVELGRGDRG